MLISERVRVVKVDSMSFYIVGDEGIITSLEGDRLFDVKFTSGNIKDYTYCIPKEQLELI